MSVVKPEFSTSSLKTETTLSELIHRIGHDIGNPLTSVISLSSLLERNDPSFQISAEDIRRYASNMVADAWKVQGIVEKVVLLLSERGQSPEPTNFRNLVQEAIRKTLRKPRFRNADILFSSSGDDFMARVDPAQGEWLVTELLSNALVAEPNTGEEIAIEAQLESHPDAVSLTIRNRFEDTLPEDLHTLFEPFVKGSPNNKGAGLGLTAALAVIERASGTLTIETKEGTFSATVTFNR